MSDEIARVSVITPSLQLKSGALVSAGASDSFCPEEKECLRCGTVFARNGAKPGQWRTRKYCSQTCSNRDHGKADDVKHCEECGVEIRRAELCKVSQTLWDRRRFCSQQCRHKFHDKQPTPKLEERESEPVRTLREWPAEARFDGPDMNVPNGPGHFVRVNPGVGRWI